MNLQLEYRPSNTHQVATVEASGRPARHPLLREDSKISNSGTSYYSAISHQSIQEEDIPEQRCHTPAPSVADVPDLSAPYTISVPSNPQHDKAGPRSTLVIPVASARPRRCFVDLDADCAVAATWPKPPETPKPKPPAEIVKIQPLTIYLGQDNKATRWDIRDWIDDCAYYTKEARERVRKPTEERQCPEYYLMKNFNPLSVHKPWSPREERTNKNMENVLMSTGWAAEPTIHRRIQLARMEEARKVHARQEAVRKAQARTARAALIAEAAFRERQARRAQQALKGSAMVKSECRKSAKGNKVHFAVDEADEADEVDEVDESSEIAPDTPGASKTVLEEVDEVPEPVDSISQNERFKIERSAPIGEQALTYYAIFWGIQLTQNPQISPSRASTHDAVQSSSQRICAGGCG